MSIDHVTFAHFATGICGNASRWASSALEGTSSLDRPVSDEERATFIVEQRDRLNRMWCYGVRGPAHSPAEGKPGSSMMNPRESTLWPRGYLGRCRQCNAFIGAAKRVSICDPCELGNRAAIDARMDELDARLAEGPPPPLAVPSSGEKR